MYIVVILTLIGIISYIIYKEEIVFYLNHLKIKELHEKSSESIKMLFAEILKNYQLCLNDLAETIKTIENSEKIFKENLAKLAETEKEMIMKLANIPTDNQLPNWATLIPDEKSYFQQIREIKTRKVEEFEKELEL